MENNLTGNSESSENALGHLKPMELNRHLTQVLQLKESDITEFEKQFLLARAEYRNRKLDLPDHALEDSIAIDARNDKNWDGRNPKQMSPEELRRISEQLALNRAKFGRIVGTVVLGAFVSIGYGLIRSRSIAIILPVAAVIVIGAAAYCYHIFINLFKKELKHGEKVKTEVEVYRVEEVSEKDRRDMGFDEDRILHFMSNKHKVKKLYFESSKRPELVNAKKVRVIQSRYAQVPFYYEKIE